jgi:type IV pilus assembly protein PilV
MTEVLVAVFIFAFGGIGAATMQVLAAQANLEAQQRSQAVYHATDILERIRNNIDALADYDAPADGQWTMVGSGSIATQPTPACDSVACTAQQQAAHDLWAWERALDGHERTRADATPAGGLVHPTGCIRNHGNGRFQVAIAWHGRRDTINASVAPGCTVTDRYGQDSQFRRVVRLRTHVQP